MTMTSPAQTLRVFDARDLWAASGINRGDALDLPGVSLAGDAYQLDPDAPTFRLRLDDGQRVVFGSEIGAPGDAVHIVARHVMMTAQGDTADLLLIRHDPEGHLYVLPLTPISPRTDYTLIESHDDPGEVRLTDLVCVAFTTGTMITLASGAQRAIEALSPGDRVLTRDHGPRPIRLVPRVTLPARGAFAPVVVAAGTLGNSGDLVVSQHHRLFLYRRGAARIGATSELLVQARHLVDGDHVWRREGGYVDYFALVFDHHEIIYAEGIPVESLLVTETTLDLLPGDLASEIRARMPDLHHAPHFGTDAGRDILEQIGRPLFDAPARRP